MDAQELMVVEEREATDIVEKTLASRRSANSERAMKVDLATIEEVFGVGAEYLPWERLTQAHLEYFVARLQGQGLSPRTINRKLSTLRQLIKAAYYDGLIEERQYHKLNDVAGARGTRIGKGRAYTAQEVAELLTGIDTSTLKGKRDKALLALMFTTGLRRSEVVAATVGDLSMDLGRATLRVLGKGDRERLVAVRADVKCLLDIWLEASGRELNPETPIFTALRKFGRGDEGEYQCITPQEPLITHAIYLLIRRYTNGELSPHDARRSFVTMALDAGATYQQVAQVTGHQSTDMVAVYETRRDAMINSAVDRLRLPSLNGDNTEDGEP